MIMQESSRRRSSSRAREADVKAYKAPKVANYFAVFCSLFCSILQSCSFGGYLCYMTECKEALSLDHLIDHFQTVVQLTARQP
jgi:hypothetical protein